MEIHGRLEGKQIVMLHGVPYTRVFYSHLDDPETVSQCQLAESEFDADLKVASPILITYLLRTVLEIRRDVSAP
jgi:hypothetical protein